MEFLAHFCSQLFRLHETLLDKEAWRIGTISTAHALHDFFGNITIDSYIVHHTLCVILWVYCCKIRSIKWTKGKCEALPTCFCFIFFTFCTADWMENFLFTELKLCSCFHPMNDLCKHYECFAILFTFIYCLNKMQVLLSKARGIQKKSRTKRSGRTTPPW